MNRSDDRAPDETGSVGDGDYVVAQGECLNSIAAAHGHLPDTIWNHSGNAEVKRTRKSPDQLLPGDRLEIPPIEEGSEDCATEKRHRFLRKAVPIELIIRVLKRAKDVPVRQVASDKNTSWEFDDAPEDPIEQPDDEPEANQKYRLEIDGSAFNGTTDDDGYVRESIVPGAQSGRLVIRPGATDERVFILALGAMDPVTEPAGAAKRLRNLGFACRDTAEMNDELSMVLRRFQAMRGIDETGALDSKTQDELKAAYGS
ncbi:MAG: LysM peptidoglycan-binding domain-containing protein [Phycisphaerales bacterium]